MKVAIVVPTIREDRIDSWASAWSKEIKENNARVYIVPDRQPTWDAIDRDLGGRGELISRQNAGIRIWGFLQALRDGADIIVSLDDDVLPSDGCIAQHVKHLTEPRIEDAWATVCPFRTRGLPYHSLDRTLNPVISHGLWTGMPDLDAATQLVRPELKLWGNEPQTQRSWVVPRGLYFPMSSMNLAFRREIAPALYFPPMGPSQPFDRFEDIWAGIVAKRVCDHLGLGCLNGAPTVHHERASDPFVNLTKEATGVQENELFWTFIDGVLPRCGSVAGCVREIAAQLISHKLDYHRIYGRNLHQWCDLVEAAG